MLDSEQEEDLISSAENELLPLLYPTSSMFT
jgi:hypothetical protein